MEMNFRKVRPVLFVSPVCFGSFRSVVLEPATDLSQFAQRFLGSSVLNVAYYINQHQFRAYHYKRHLETVSGFVGEKDRNHSVAGAE